MKKLAYGSFLFLSFACKTPQGKSSLRHEWGRTDLKGHELNCKEEPLGPYQEYMRLHLNRIAAGNPTVFVDALDPKKFCITPVEMDEIDAGSSWDGSLFINTGILKATQNDAQFAAVLAHEIAHITLRHGMTEAADFVAAHPDHKAEYEKLTAAYETARAKATAAAGKFAAGDEAYKTKLRSLLQKEWNRSRFSAKAAMNCEAVPALFVKAEDKALRDAAKDPASCEKDYCERVAAELDAEHKLGAVFSNWRESEADEVGFEFYLRAGYAADEYTRFFENAEAISGPGKNCERGDKDHPGDCWRAANIKAEISKHRAHISYGKGYGAVGAVDLFDKRLMDLRKAYGY